jgi:tyrosyl-tRNA synthetase
MPSTVPHVLDTLTSRGFIAQLTSEPAVRTLLGGPPTVIYTGYDPTADSLHVGNLVTLMALQHLERAGHKIVVLIGEGTAKVGDPSGKTSARPMLTPEQINLHAQGLTAQVGRFLQVGSRTRVLSNAAWLDGLNYLDFLRDIGRYFSVKRMLSFEAYRSRLETSLSFLEFNYQLLQAFDFLTLHRDHGCMLQLGGDDQWGNIVAGVELTRRVCGASVCGLTLPLLTTATGEKMGKTHTGALWLDANRVSPFDYYQYFVNTHDADVARLLAIFTFLPMAQIEAVAELQGAELNQAKSILAYEACKLVHGSEAAQQAHQAAQSAFGGRHLDPQLLADSSVPRNTEASAQAMPQTLLQESELQAGMTMVQILVHTALAASNNAARRLIEQGGVRLGEQPITDPLQRIDAQTFSEGPQTLRVGKKRAHRLILKKL